MHISHIYNSKDKLQPCDVISMLSCKEISIITEISYYFINKKFSIITEIYYYFISKKISKSQKYIILY